MAQRVTLANENLKIATSNPGLHNIREAYRRVYEALGTKDIDSLLRPDEVPVPKDPAIENLESMQMKIPQAFPQQDHDAHINAHRAFMATRMVQINPMVYANLQAHISQHISLKAQGEIGSQVAADMDMQLLIQQDPQGAEIQINAMIARRIAEITTELAQAETQTNRDPLVQLKQRELDLRAMEVQRKTMQDMESNEIRENEIEENLEIQKMKLENQEDQAAERIKVAREKLDLQRKKNAPNRKR
jgi:hypothetical protein